MNLQLIAAALALVGAAAFAAGWTVQGWRADAADKARVEAELELASLRAQKGQEASAGHEHDKERDGETFRIIYRNVDRVVEKPVYRNVCLDDDGLRLLSESIAGSAAAGQPQSALPTTGAPR